METCFFCKAMIEAGQRYERSGPQNPICQGCGRDLEYGRKPSSGKNSPPRRGRAG